MEGMGDFLIENFEQKLTLALLAVASDCGFADKQLLQSDDITDRWQVFAPEYMADAVPEVNKYPNVSVSWAAYLGMAVAWGWDNNWSLYHNVEYKFYYGNQGFDNMDDHITVDVIGLALGSADEVKLRNCFRKLADTTISAIRHEQVDPQSQFAFFLFHSACKIMYKIGASIQLKRMGYKLEKIN